MSFRTLQIYVDYGNGSSTGYFSVTAWSASASKVCGDLIRATAPAVNSERVFVCTASTGGTGQTGGTEPTWVTTQGAATTDNTLTWHEATGVPALNGDKTNTPTWTTVKNSTIVVGEVIKSDNGNFILICTTAGTAGNGSEPSWSAYTAAGATTADSTVTWKTLKDSGNNFSNWASPHARLNAANSQMLPAGIAYIASEHAETQASSNTLTLEGSLTQPCYFYCVDKNNVPPTSANLTTGASITTTGTSSMTVTVSFNYFYGLTFSAASGATSTGLNIGSQSNGCGQFVNCVFKAPGTSGNSSKILLGSTSSAVATKYIWDNCTLQFGSTGDSLAIRNCNFEWRNTTNALPAGSIPTALLISVNFAAYALIKGVDFSALGSGKTLVRSTTFPSQFYFVDCKFGASMTVYAAPTGIPGAVVHVIRGDSSGTNYRCEKYNYLGTQTTETSIVRVGGASDGVTPISWQLDTNADSRWVVPFDASPININNMLMAANRTVTVYGTWNSGSVPNNDDIWMEISYFGSASTILHTIATTTKADNMASGTSLTSDTSTWGGGGSGGGWSPFKITKTLSSPQPQQEGFMYITIKAARASSTFYIDPLVVLS